MFVSDFFDFSIYVDAHESDIEHWYIERFMKLRATIFQNPSSYFHKYAELSAAEQDAIFERTARQVYRLREPDRARQHGR